MPSWLITNPPMDGISRGVLTPKNTHLSVEIDYFSEVKVNSLTDKLSHRHSRTYHHTLESISQLKYTILTNGIPQSIMLASQYLLINI